MAKSGKSYNDIDIVAVIKSNFENVELELQKLIQKNYKNYIREDTKIPPHRAKPGIKFASIFYHCGENKERRLEFAWCYTFKDSFSYKAYQDNNWFHQLS